jgi:predicted RNA methylase
MLKDSTRTKVYERAILNNCHLFKDKVVLDVGAGTLILSMMAGEAFPYLVRAGARKVYAVEEAGISKHASKVIAANHMEGKIVVVERVLEVDHNMR